MFLKVFLCFCVFRVFPNCPFQFLLKNFFKCIFASNNLPTKMRKQISVFSKIYTESFATTSRVEAIREICQSTSEAILRVDSREAYPRNEQFWSF